MRLDHEEFSCNPPVSTTTVSYATPPNGRDLMENEGRGLVHVVATPPVVDEFVAAQELSRKIATSGLQNDAFLLANEDQLVANYAKWAKQFPKIQTFFDVACNACPWVLTSLDEMNVKFSCQSKVEIQHVLDQGIDSSKIYFAGQTKVGSHIKFANASKVPLMSFGTFGELKKIQTAKINTDLQIHGLLLALQLPTGNPETDRQWLDLLNAAKDLGFNVAGVSFETAMTDKSKAKGHFNKMMALTKMAFTIGCSLGHSMKMIDIGLMDKTFSNGQEEFEIAINKHLQGLEHEFIGHIGTNFIENVFTCGAKIIGKRVGSYQNALVINEGIFNSFTRLMVDDDFVLDDIRPLKAKNSVKSSGLVSMNKKNAFDLYGSSGDDMDILAQDFLLDQDVVEEDWLFFPMMGAFSFSIQSNMVSVPLPKRLGNFRLFQAPGESVEDGNEFNGNSEKFGLNVEQVLISEEDGLEVVFLDIQGNLENDQQEKTCLDLFEELPNFNIQDTKFWENEEFLSDLR